MNILKDLKEKYAQKGVLEGASRLRKQKERSEVRKKGSQVVEWDVCVVQRNMKQFKVY